MNRLFKSRSFWILFATGVTTIGYWYISTWDKSVISDVKTFPYPWNQTPFSIAFYNGLLKNKIKAGLAFGLLSIFVQTVIIYFPISIKRKKFIKGTLSHIIKQYLEGDVTNNRITIYVVKRGYRMYLSYIWKCFMVNVVKHYKRKLLRPHLRSFPRPFRKYLVFSGRSGKPHEDGTSTFFLIPESEDEISGIAAYVFYEDKPQFVELPDISHIDFDSMRKIEDLTEPEHKLAVEKYMEEGKVNSFDKLKMFHRHPQHLYATPIYDNKNDPFGVIVFDSMEKKTDFKNNLDNLLGYCKITENIINYIN